MCVVCVWVRGVRRANEYSHSWLVSSVKWLDACMDACMQRANPLTQSFVSFHQVHTEICFPLPI